MKKRNNPLTLSVRGRKRGYMFVRASQGSGGGGGSYELIDIPALSAGNTYATDVSVSSDTHLYVSVVCPQTNGVYIFGGLFEITGTTVTALKTNTNRQVRPIVQNGKLAVNTTVATVAGMALVVEA